MCVTMLISAAPPPMHRLIQAEIQAEAQAEAHFDEHCDAHLLPQDRKSVV